MQAGAEEKKTEKKETEGKSDNEQVREGGGKKKKSEENSMKTSGTIAPRPGWALRSCLVCTVCLR